MPFFPDLPPVVNEALLLGLLLAVGIVFGELVRRIRLPPVSGYILAGLVLGPVAFNLPVRPLLDEARLVIDLGVGLVLFELGRRLDLRWMQRDPSLWVSAVLESSLSFAAMFAVLVAFDTPAIEAAVAAAIGSATSPAVVWLVAHDTRAQGQVTERCLSLAALNSLVAFVLVAIFVAVLHHEYRAGWTTVLLHPLYLFAGSVVLGIGTGGALLSSIRFLARHPEAHFAGIVAAVLCAVGLAAMLKLSVFIALLAAGAMVRNATRRFTLLDADLGGGARMLYVLLFVITGASLPLSALGDIGWAAAAFVAARALGKWTGVMAAAPISPLPWRQSALLGVTLMPMSAVALILLHDVTRLYPAVGAKLAVFLLAAILVFELIGPPLLQWSLRVAGDVPPAKE